MAIVIDSVGIKGLRVAHLRQLQAYIETRDETGWHYGPREQFEVRHDDLAVWINNIVEMVSDKGVVIPKE